MMPISAGARKNRVSNSRMAVVIYGSACFLSLVMSSFASAGNPADSVEAKGGGARTANPGLPVADLDEALKPLSGRQVYQRVCMACHTLSVWGAPKLGDRAAWTDRIGKGRQALYFSAQNGFNKMPPRGYCDFCTNDELRSAVDYLVEKVEPRERGDD
jgi:cytochrome c5